MSRHRRQASQAIPPEIFSGDFLAKPFDLNLVSVSEEATGTKATTISQHNTTQEIKVSAPATTTTPPANPKNLPPPGTSA